MSYLFDFGELLICIAPIFLVMVIIFGGLIWNSLPKRTVEKEERND